MSELIKWVSEYWLAVLFGGISTWCATLVAQNRAVKAGMRALLRDRIIQSYNYRVDQGFCPIYALTSILDMYEQYKALKGNHGVAELVEKLKELPTSAPEKRKQTRKKGEINND